MSIRPRVVMHTHPPTKLPFLNQSKHRSKLTTTFRTTEPLCSEASWGVYSPHKGTSHDRISAWFPHHVIPIMVGKHSPWDIPGMSTVIWEPWCLYIRLRSPHPCHMIKVIDRLRRPDNPGWRHDMGTLSTLLTLCDGNPPVTSGFPLQRSSYAQLWYYVW